MDKHTLYIITFTILITVSVSSLAALGESRLDVYTSIFTLEYLHWQQYLGREERR